MIRRNRKNIELLTFFPLGKKCPSRIGRKAVITFEWWDRVDQLTRGKQLLNKFIIGVAFLWCINEFLFWQENETTFLNPAGICIPMFLGTRNSRTKLTFSQKTFHFQTPCSLERRKGGAKFASRHTNKLSTAAPRLSTYRYAGTAAKLTRPNVVGRRAVPYVMLRVSAPIKTHYQD